jgi:hypothetical protein
VSRADNLNRAAKLIRRLSDIRGGLDEFDGVSLDDIAFDCLMVANQEKMREKLDAALIPDKVVEMHGYSRKVPCG